MPRCFCLCQEVCLSVCLRVPLSCPFLIVSISFCPFTFLSFFQFLSTFRLRVYPPFLVISLFFYLPACLSLPLSIGLTDPERKIYVKTAFLLPPPPMFYTSLQTESTNRIKKINSFLVCSCFSISMITIFLSFPNCIFPISRTKSII